MQAGRLHGAGGSRIGRHIKPLLGTMKVPAVMRADVERFMHAIVEGETAQRVKLPRKRALSNVRGGKGAASRTLGLLGAIFAHAERKRTTAENPVRGVIRYADCRHDRRLSNAEYAALGKALPPQQPASSTTATRPRGWLR
jgi:hypothetical protein